MSKFNDFVTDRLQAGALEGLKAAGVAQRRHLRHQGAGRIRDSVRGKGSGRARERSRRSICLGCLIRGATAHFEYIASACAHGITDAAAATGVPMTFGVLTTNSVEEALERAGDGPANKGWEAADCGCGDGHAAALAAAAETDEQRQRMSGADAAPSGTKHRTRHRARQAAVQMLYQCEVGQHDIEDVVRTFWSANLPGSEGAPESVRTFAEQLVRLTMANLEKIDPLIVETAEHWRLSRMAALDRIILRLAISEFLDGVHAAQRRHQRSTRTGEDVQRRRIGEVRQWHTRRREKEAAVNWKIGGLHRVA